MKQPTDQTILHSPPDLNDPSQQRRLKVSWHLYRHNKVVAGQKAFSEYYLISRRRALEEAHRCHASGDVPEIGNIEEQATEIPHEGRPSYREWMEMLVDSYMDLLAAEGKDYPELVRSVFENRSDYLLHLNQLNRLEKAFHVQLAPRLDGENAHVADVIASMERHAETLRRKHAERIFPRG